MYAHISIEKGQKKGDILKRGRNPEIRFTTDKDIYKVAADMAKKADMSLASFSKHLFENMLCNEDGVCKLMKRRLAQQMNLWDSIRKKDD